MNSKALRAVVFCMISSLPYALQRLLERHGIEEDSMSHRDGNIYIEIDDVEIAFQVREVMLQHGSCKLISHPVSKKPTLEINDIKLNHMAIFDALIESAPEEP